MPRCAPSTPRGARHACCPYGASVVCWGAMHSDPDCLGLANVDHTRARVACRNRNARRLMSHAAVCGADPLRTPTNCGGHTLCPQHWAPCAQHVFEETMDTLGIEPRASRMLSGCDTTTPCARLIAQSRPTPPLWNGLYCQEGRAHTRAADGARAPLMWMGDRWHRR